MKRVHFFQRMLRRPTIESNAIRGKKNARAIAAQPTVNENFLVRMFGNERKKFRHLFVCRRAPAIARNQNELHSKRFGSFFFIRTFAPKFSTKIDDRGHAEFMQ